MDELVRDPWTWLGFLAVAVPVILYYGFSARSPRRGPSRPAGGADIDEGVDL